MLGRAFHTNPGMVWGFPDERTRHAKLSWFMRLGAKIGDKQGESYATPGAVEGAALWMPPGKTTISLGQMIGGGIPRGAGALGHRRVHEVQQRVQQVRASAQGGDAGRPLVPVRDRRRPAAPGAGHRQRADGAGTREGGCGQLPCYLETDKPEDVVFYQKHGFEVVEKLSVKDSPPFWTMARPLVGDPPIEVVPLDASQIDDAADVLARAFFDYPIWPWMAPDETHRRELMPWFMRMSLRWGTLVADTYTTAPAIRGVAMWEMLPEREIDHGDAELEAMWNSLPERMGADGIARFQAMIDTQRPIRERECGSRADVVPAVAWRRSGCAAERRGPRVAGGHVRAG